MKDLEFVNGTWLKQKLKEHNMSQTGFANELGMLPHNVSEFIHGTTGCTRRTKLAFYYYFRTLELLNEKENK